MKRFSKNWAYDVLYDAERKLLTSDIDNDIKDIIKSLPIFIAINCQLRCTAGQLYVISNDDSNTRKIPKSHKDWTVPVDGENCYICLELSAHHIHWDSSKEIRNTIVHELAHGINFVDAGKISRPTSDWHNSSWHDIHSALGDKPKIFHDMPRYPWQIEKYHEIALEFDL